ncbi:MAG: hypothetical protein K2K32_05935 [Muribaculaceae bacterium]|nr:hypothetical protein [Muribaculaceae bacterium]
MIRRLIFNILLVLPMVFMVIGCSDDLRNYNVGDVGDDVAIPFTVDNISLMRDGNSLDWESEIDHAYLLFYDYSDSDEEHGDIPVTFVRAEIKDHSPGMLTFKMPLILEENKDYRLVAVANADNYVPDGFSSFGNYLSACNGEVSAASNSPIHLYKAGAITSELSLLPMVGSPENDGKFSFTNQNGAYQVSASLRFRRSVARVDVVNIVKEGFEVEGVAICNWRDAVTLENSNTEVGAIHSKISDFLDSTESDESGIQKIMGQLYCFPSVSENASPGDNLTTALIIKAKYGDDESPTYYRVNVGVSGSHAEIKVNTKYSVTIQSVRGRGAATPEEAYVSEDNLLVLSMVEDWDFEGNFAMDDYGNFIILSRGSLEFTADSQENVEVKVLSSKGLQWNAEYLSDSENSTDAFKVSKISDNSLIISPVGINNGKESISGKCRVSAVTSQGNTLTVDISLRQLSPGDSPYEPVIPWEKDFALVPLQGDRVKVDHNAMTIEIDGFDPDCFNSFIDIPFQVYINDKYSTKQINIYNELTWPLEGRISKETSSDYVYCVDSYTLNKRTVISKTEGTEIAYNKLYESGFNVKNNDTIYVSIGAMAPDDPAIVKDIQIGELLYKVIYKLTIKPRNVIIDDVILSDSNGNRWLIKDRNVEDLKAGHNDLIGRDSNNGKILRQAYNYTSVGNPALQIPFKKTSTGDAFDEGKHELSHGVFVKYNNRNDLSNNNQGIIRNWFEKYLYSEGQERTSPFYEDDNIDSWRLPEESVLNLCVTNMRVSKLRMYLMSEVSAKSNKSLIPICCYWPYRGAPMGNTTDFTYGYYFADSEGNPMSVKLIYCDKTEVKTFLPSSQKEYNGFSRIMRPLSELELDNFKKNYLGYGNQPHKLTICHPDTYTTESNNWNQY